MNIDIETIYDKICTIEKELATIKSMLDGTTNSTPKRTVSLEGLGQILVSDEELDRAIKEAKMSIFSGAKDELH